MYLLRKAFVLNIPLLGHVLQRIAVHVRVLHIHHIFPHRLALLVLWQLLEVPASLPVDGKQSGKSR